MCPEMNLRSMLLTGLISFVIKMVFYSTDAEDDLTQILIGLICWKKHPLSREHAIKYVSKIRIICDSIGQKSQHISTRNDLKEFGYYTYYYRRNKSTVWFIIYDISQSNHVFINRILSSHEIALLHDL